MRSLDWIHGRFVHPRRVSILTGHLSSLLPQGAAVLDVGCGDGRLAATLGNRRPDLLISGLDVLPRTQTAIRIGLFDGVTIPIPDRSVDAVMLIDVLHHTDDPMVLLREARRVTRTSVLIKDHTRDGFLAGPTLRLMDRTGNARHGVVLPYNYWTSHQWRRAFADVELHVTDWLTNLRLYPVPARWVFDRSLHFIALLTKPT